MNVSNSADHLAPGVCPHLARLAELQRTLPSFPPPRDDPMSPPPVYTELRKANILGKVRLWDGKEAWLITRYEDVRAVLSDPRFSSDMRLPGYPTVSAAMKVARGKNRTFITMDPPDHTTQRRMLTGEFSIKRVEAFRPKVREIVNLLIDKLMLQEQPADLVEGLTLSTPAYAICELLGVPYEDHDFFQAQALILTSSTASLEEAVAANDALCEKYLRQLVRHKVREPKEDILSRLVVNYVSKGELTEDQVVSLARLLLIAGHETTANTTAMGVLLLLQRPSVWEELRQNPSLVPQAIEEMLRFVDVTHSGKRRVALQDVPVGGQLIRAGEAVIVLSVAANRDEGAFSAPEHFDIHREARHQVSFGYGIHQCIGQPLARMEMHVLFEALLQRMPKLRLAVPFEELEFKTDSLMYGVKALPVAW